LQVDLIQLLILHVLKRNILERKKSYARNCTLACAVGIPLFVFFPIGGLIAFGVFGFKAEESRMKKNKIKRILRETCANQPQIVVVQK